ncbi:pyruvate dehydrogenase (acetyl-transferring), homodimeric type [Cyclobacterium salsum]|uniref:pyruvate dehydrogenase (acetyl-transferring), homodimeric type n=1 Tax=Cyclobacterium salsum TaxID=2666329 RepID=UPI0013914E6F|nr:pyruvate dehydrogenase (acetyl-transferring), homodimeric type [Cyclobacterium salsum]
MPTYPDAETKRIEDREWRSSLLWVIENEAPERAVELLNILIDSAREKGISFPDGKLTTDYINTIPHNSQKEYPGDLEIEERIYNAIRWNAMVMVVKANEKISGIGGHISTFSSASTLFEVALTHFLKGYQWGHPDVAFFQGHAAPGLYARSFLEHRFSEDALSHFRMELQFEDGLSSYPHPRLMPSYWRFPSVSMGLAPIQAIYQARFFKYLQNRGIGEKTNQLVWAFLGDGEMDEPESTGALSIASREKLDNLTFVINCNLQRLDGPVRGNNSVIQEFEGLFRGAGWHVIRVLWDSTWDELFENDKKGKLTKRLQDMIDGKLQRLSVADGKTLKKELFGGDPDLEKLVEDWSDEKIESLGRGGHDKVKVFNAFHAATVHEGSPVVVLAQTIKGYEQGDAGEASNVAHKTKVFSKEELQVFRDELKLPIADDKLDDVPFYRFEQDSDEYRYLRRTREVLGGPLPYREQLAKEFEMPDEKIFEEYKEGSAEKEVPTTGVFVKILTQLLKDKHLKDKVVPIIPDESRTFGMDSLFSQFGIYAAEGQKYEPVDQDSLMFYNEKKDGVILEEGITEAGAMSSFIAAGTNHISQDKFTIPFYVFYSMFGMQRIGDLVWAAADARARGFMIGGISGRTTLSGEGLQHQDGQSHLNALAVPNLRAYDPAFAYELAVIIQDGLKRMYAENQDIFYYITIMNEAYQMPKMPANAEKDIINGLYRLEKSRKRKNKSDKVHLLGSGAIMKEVREAKKILEDDCDLPVDIWSVTSYKALYEEARETERQNRMEGKSKQNFIQSQLSDEGDLFIAASDYVKALPQSIAKWIPGDFIVLGTDGFGRSDSIPALRNFFEVDAKHIAFTALRARFERGDVKKAVLQDFMTRYDIKADKQNPTAH